LCWIKGHGDAWRLLFYGPLLVYIITAIALLVQILRKHQVIFVGIYARRSLSRMIAFVVVFVLIWLFPLCLRWYEFIFESADDDEKPPKSLIILHELCTGSSGFANFVVWATCPAVQEFICQHHRGQQVGSNGEDYESSELHEFASPVAPHADMDEPLMFHNQYDNEIFAQDSPRIDYSFSHSPQDRFGLYGDR
jgi:hypothetical protein